jgi:hypothetical protein
VAFGAFLVTWWRFAELDFRAFFLGWALAATMKAKEKMAIVMMAAFFILFSTGVLSPNECVWGRVAGVCHLVDSAFPSSPHPSNDLPRDWITVHGRIVGMLGESGWGVAPKPVV